MRSTSFTGRSAIVTGAASGIGRAIAAQLVGEGAHVTAVDVDGASLDRAVGELGDLPNRGGSISGRTLDVSDREAVRSMVGQVAHARGLDLMFNNAGVSAGGRTHEMSVSQWDQLVDVNIWGVVNGVLAAYPLMVEQRHGHIVNTASAAGLAPPPFVSAYAMTKHAVVGLSLALRSEAALEGVRVSVLCPGAVETPILDAVPADDLSGPTSPAITAREYLAMVGQKPIPADRFARAALAGVARNKAVIVHPGRTKALWYLDRISTGLMGVVTRSVARKVDGHLDGTR